MLNSVKEFIRSGGYAWPGGYQCALLMADGECIDAQAARENCRQIVRAHSNREIPSAYGETENV